VTPTRAVWYIDQLFIIIIIIIIMVIV